MQYNQLTVKEYVLKKLESKIIRHEVHNFHSGVSMIDIWYNGKFYVIQFENESVGLSLLEANGDAEFNTMPDERFFNDEDFLSKFDNLFGSGINGNGIN